MNAPENVSSSIVLGAAFMHGKSREFLCKHFNITPQELNYRLKYFKSQYEIGAKIAFDVEKYNEYSRSQFQRAAELEKLVIRLEAEIRAIEEWQNKREWRLKK